MMQARAQRDQMRSQIRERKSCLMSKAVYKMVDINEEIDGR
jgi:hypothetical protein